MRPILNNPAKYQSKSCYHCSNTYRQNGGKNIQPKHGGWMGLCNLCLYQLHLELNNVFEREPPPKITGNYFDYGKEEFVIINKKDYLNYINRR